MKTVFKKSDTLRNCLTRVKGTHKNSTKGVIYQIPYVDCDQVYIGETGRRFLIRLKEHQREVMQGDWKKANTVHYMETGHQLDWKYSQKKS